MGRNLPIRNCINGLNIKIWWRMLKVNNSYSLIRINHFYPGEYLHNTVFIDITILLTGRARLFVGLGLALQ